MAKYEFSVVLETVQELTPAQVVEYFRFLGSGMQGFYQDTPQFLRGANATVSATGETAEIIRTKRPKSQAGEIGPAPLGEQKPDPPPAPPSPCTCSCHRNPNMVHCVPCCGRCGEQF